MIYVPSYSNILTLISVEVHSVSAGVDNEEEEQEFDENAHYQEFRCNLFLLVINPLVLALKN